jgi:hypothetical protein
VLCGVNCVVVAFAVAVSLSRHLKEQRELRRRQEARVQKVEWAVGFTADKFRTTFEAVVESSVPPSHALVFYFASLAEIKQVLRSGVSVSTQWQGVLVSLHRPHDLTKEEKDAFPCREAIVACALPKRLLFGAPVSVAAGEASTLRIVKGSVLEAMRGSHLGDLVDPGPWAGGRVLLPPQCIERAYQLEEVSPKKEKEDQQRASEMMASSFDTSVGDVEDQRGGASRSEPVLRVKAPATCGEFADTMASIRLHCGDYGSALPLYLDIYRPLHHQGRLAHEHPGPGRRRGLLQHAGPCLVRPWLA